MQRFKDIVSWHQHFCRQQLISNVHFCGFEGFLFLQKKLYIWHLGWALLLDAGNIKTKKKEKKNKKNSRFGPKHNTSNQTHAGLYLLLLLLLTLVSIPFVPMSISPAHRTLTPVQTGLQMAAVPHSLTWCRTVHRSSACSGNPLWPTLSDWTRKDSIPLYLDPGGLEPSVTPLPTNHRGISPIAPTLPWPEWSGAVTGHTSGIRSSSRLRSRRGYLLRAREQGQAWDGGVGPE